MHGLMTSVIYIYLSWYSTLKLLLSNASWYGCVACSKTCSLDEIEQSLLLTDAGMFLSMQGGWLLSLCT